MSRLELPDGKWAELDDPRKVPERKRRRYIAAMTNLTSGTADLPRNPNDPNTPDPVHFTGAHMALSDTLGDMLILCIVREWSYGEVSVEVLEELPVDAFEQIFKRCRDLAPELTPDYGVDPDPKARSGGLPPSPQALSTGEQTYGTPSFVITS